MYTHTCSNEAPQEEARPRRAQHPRAAELMALGFAWTTVYWQKRTKVDESEVGPARHAGPACFRALNLLAFPKNIQSN